VSAQWDLLSLLTLIVTVAAPAAGQPAAPIPDISGSWNHAALNGLELPLSGPGPVRNSSRMHTGPQAGVGDRAQPVLARAGALCLCQLWNAGDPAPRKVTISILSITSSARCA
jgi:hypothetical protein